MNGVDHADQLRMQYSCARKSRKYWKYIYYFLLDICIGNEFLLMKMSPNHVLASNRGRIKQREQVDYRRKLATQLIVQHRANRKRSVSNIDKTYKMHSEGTLPFQDAFRKQDKTYSCITRCQDLQDAFDRHARLSRSVHKNKTRRIRA